MPDEPPPPPLDLEAGVSPDALTTVAQVMALLHLDLLEPNQQALLAMLVNQTSCRIERLCARRFVARRWVERPAKPEGTTLILRHYPIQQIVAISAGHRSSLEIGYDPRLPLASQVLQASVSVLYDATGTTGQVVLATTAVDGNTQTIELSLADHLTVSALASAINQHAGWQAQAQGDAPSPQLWPCVCVDALQVKASLTRSAQAVSVHALEHAQGLVRLKWPYRQVMVDYTAGYDPLPGDLVLLATELVAQAYEQSQMSQMVTSERLGDYSYTLASQSKIDRNQWNILQLYQEVR